jgi:hypothetical protein
MAIRTASLLAGIGLLATSVATPLAAQATSDPGPACPYAQCGLGISPVWNGLTVVRGQQRLAVANLDFFWPRPVSAAMSGDSARTYATRAFTVRRRAAVLTDAGALLLLAGAARGAHAGRLDTPSRALLLTGAGSLAVSIPLQFSADAWLSRAVWWHNAVYSR